MKSQLISCSTSPRATLELGHKKRLGQYFTGSKLAALLARIAFAENATSAIDPMAGNGDMLEAVSKLAPAANLYGIEIDPRHIETAKHRLPEHSQIIEGNAFAWDTIAKLSSLSFDLVITNPPYVRYQSLSASAGSSLPDADRVRSGLLDIIARIPGLHDKDRKIFNVLTRTYSGLSDLAVPSWILCAMLVKPGGTIAMVAPEAWLTRDYADCIHYLLLKLFRLRWVIDNEARDWFDDAQIKTSLLVAQRTEQPRDLVKALSGESFMRVSLDRKSRDDRGPAGGLFPKSSDPAMALRDLMIDAQAGPQPPVDGAHLLKRDLPAKLNDLIASAGTAQWLRALESWIGTHSDPVALRTAKVPQPLLNLLSIDCANRLRTLPDIGLNIGQGLRTGANLFFYCDRIQSDKKHTIVTSGMALHHKVRMPNKALLPALRKQAEVPQGFTINYERLSGRVLLLNYFSPPELAVPEEGRRLMPDDLRHLVMTAQITNIGSLQHPKFIPELSAVLTNVSAPSLRNGWSAHHWYMLPPLVCRHRPDLLVARVNTGHPKTMLNPDRMAVIDANFSTLWREAESTAPPVVAILAMLNSTWCLAAMELLGNIMGGGALKLEATHLRKLPIPDLSLDNWRKLEILGEALTAGRTTVETLDEIDRVIAAALFERNRANKALIALRQINARCLEVRKK